MSLWDVCLICQQVHDLSQPCPKKMQLEDLCPYCEEIKGFQYLRKCKIWGTCVQKGYTAPNYPNCPDYKQAEMERSASFSQTHAQARNSNQTKQECVANEG